MWCVRYDDYISCIIILDLENMKFNGIGATGNITDNVSNSINGLSNILRLNRRHDEIPLSSPPLYLVFKHEVEFRTGEFSLDFMF